MRRAATKREGEEKKEIPKSAGSLRGGKLIYEAGEETKLSGRMPKSENRRSASKKYGRNPPTETPAPRRGAHSKRGHGTTPNPSGRARVERARAEQRNTP